MFLMFQSMSVPKLVFWLATKWCNIAWQPIKTETTNSESMWAFQWTVQTCLSSHSIKIGIALGLCRLWLTLLPTDFETAMHLRDSWRSADVTKEALDPLSELFALLTLTHLGSLGLTLRWEDRLRVSFWGRMDHNGVGLFSWRCFMVIFMFSFCCSQSAS